MATPSEGVAMRTQKGRPNSRIADTSVARRGSRCPKVP
jgi:hypothetical protein